MIQMILIKGHNLSEMPLPLVRRGKALNFPPYSWTSWKQDIAGSGGNRESN